MLTGVELVGVKPGSGGGEDPPNLNDIAGPIDGSFTNFSYDIPDNINTVSMKWRLTCPGTGQDHDAIILDNILVTGTPLTPDSFNNWVALTTTFELDDQGAPDADPDCDKIPNLLEYAFGGSATEPDSGILPTAEIIDIEGTQYLSIKWRQLNQTLTGTLSRPIDGFTVRDIKYIPQVSTDGKFWLDGDAVLFSDLESEEEFVEIQAYFIDPITDTQPRRFGRIKIELNGQ